MGVYFLNWDLKMLLEEENENTEGCLCALQRMQTTDNSSSQPKMTTLKTPFRLVDAQWQSLSLTCLNPEVPPPTLYKHSSKVLEG